MPSWHIVELTKNRVCYPCTTRITASAFPGIFPTGFHSKAPIIQAQTLPLEMLLSDTLNTPVQQVSALQQRAKPAERMLSSLLEGWEDFAFSSRLVSLPGWNVAIGNTELH